MKRDFERKLLYILSIWQIIDGIITCGYYGIFISLTNTMNKKTLIPGYTIVTIGLGGFLIILGLMNSFVLKNQIKDNQVLDSYVWLLIVESIISYLIMDIIGLILLISIIVIALAKNKAIKVSNQS